MKNIYKVRKIMEEYGDIKDKENFNLDRWLNSLNDKQIDNFLKLDISKTIFKKLFYVIINSNMLNLNDYVERIKCLSYLNIEISFHEVLNLLNSGFLYSDKLFEDVKIFSNYSKEDLELFFGKKGFIYGNHFLINLKILFSLFSKKDFIDSKYHFEDLKLILKFIKEDKLDKIYYLVPVVCNIDSINSVHHREDMNLLATSKIDSYRLTDNKQDAQELREMEHYNLCLLTDLAINKISLNDPRHHSNMCLLTGNNEYNSILYKLMTDSDSINGKYYKDEIEIISKCKTYNRALNLYNYINPDTYELKCKYLDLLMWWYSPNYPNFTSGRIGPNYLENLNYLLNVNEEFLEYYIMLFLNPIFMSSKNRNLDLETLKKAEGTNNFIYLFKIMFNGYFLESEYHEHDLRILTRIDLSKDIKYNKYLYSLPPSINDIILDIACRVASKPDNIYHEFDMSYLYELSKIPNLSSVQINAVENNVGNNDIDHIIVLAALLEIIIANNDKIDESTKVYLEKLGEIVSSPNILKEERKIQLKEERGKQKIFILPLYKNKKL